MLFAKSIIMTLPLTIFNFRKQLQMAIISMGFTNSTVHRLILLLPLVGLETAQLPATYLLDMGLVIRMQE